MCSPRSENPTSLSTSVSGSIIIIIIDLKRYETAVCCDNNTIL